MVETVGTSDSRKRTSPRWGVREWLRYAVVLLVVYLSLFLLGRVLKPALLAFPGAHVVGRHPLAVHVLSRSASFDLVSTAGFREVFDWYRVNLTHRSLPVRDSFFMDTKGGAGQQDSLLYSASWRGVTIVRIREVGDSTQIRVVTGGQGPPGIVLIAALTLTIWMGQRFRLKD